MALDGIDRVDEAGENPVATDKIGANYFQLVKVTLGAIGTDDSSVSSANPMPTTGVITGTVAVTQSGTWDEVGINDSGNSITVDAPTGTPVNVQVGDGSNTATIRNLAANDALNVAIVDGAGDQITTFGGGTQYTEGDTDATITGTAMLMEGAANALVVPVAGGGTEAAALRVTVASDSTGVLSVDDNGGSLTVDGTVTANLAAGTNNIGDVDVLTIAAGDNNIGNVDIVTMPNVTLAAGTNTNEVVGDAAHGASVAGNPLLNGLECRTTIPTAVTDGQVVRAQGDTEGKTVTTPHSVRALVVDNNISLTTTSETTLIAAGAANVFRDLTLITLSNESSTKVRVDIKDSTAGTTKLSVTLAADGGGAVIPFPCPKKQGTAANNWTATLSAAVSTVYICAQAIERK